MSKIYKAVVSIGLSCTLAATSTFSASAILQGHTIQNYPCYLQSGANCWAYVIKSMYDYMTGSLISINTVYSAYAAANGSYYVNNAGANLQQSYNVVNYLMSGYSPSMYNGALTFSSIMTKVNANKPSFIGGYYQDSTGTHGHSVALIGYYDFPGSADAIFYMNPATGNVENCAYITGSTSFFISLDHAYNWSAGGTIILS